MDIIDIVLSKKYTDESIKGITGALAGKNCTIKSATKADGVTTVVFAWTADDGTEKTTTIQVNDGAKGDIGIGIDNVTINANSHLIVTLSDGSTIDAGLIQGGSGTDDYEDLINRPKIEGVDLIGNKTFEDLGVASATDLAQTDGHLQDLADLVGDKVNLPMPNETVVNNIEYVDTKVDGLIDDNVTGLTKTFSSDKIAKTFATLEEVNERIPQYEIMPTATESCGGQVVQFIGTSTSDYTHGYFYECVSEGSGYIWKNIGVQAIPVNLSELTNDSGYITVNVDNLVNYYLKTETYSQAEVDEIIGKLNRLTTEIVTALPTENISTTTIYLIKVGETNNYTQHMYIGDAWADLGSTTIDLSGYVSKQQLITTLADYVKSTDLQAHVDNNTVHLTIEDRDNLTNLLLDEHNHGNKTILDGILQAQVDNWNEAFTDKHTHDNKTVLDGITSTKVSDWDSAKTHADSAHAPSNAQENVIETVKVNGTALTPSNKAVNIDLSDYAKTADVNDSISTLQTDKADASDLTAHTGDSVIHVTAENKTLWNTVSNKVNKEDGKALLADTDKTNYDDAVTKAHTHENKEVLDGITSDKVTYWDNKSEFSGSYNDLNDKPTIDAELSNTSENAIQNKVVTKEINKLYSDISFNDFDTATDGISFTDAEDGNMIVTDWTKNLLNPTVETCEVNGVTCTNNGDGTYTLNGTVNKNSVLNFVSRDSSRNFIKKFIGKKLKFIYIINEVEQLGKSYMCIGQSLSEDWKKWGGQIDNGKSQTIYDNIVGIVCDLHMFAGDVFNNVLIKPMLTTDLNATYDDFVPYGGYEIKTCGKNIVQNTLTNETINGITSVLNPDRSISFNGTASAVAIFAFAPKALKTFWNNCKGDVKLLGCPTDSPGTSSHYLQIWTPNGKTFVDDGKGIVIKESDRVGIPFGNIAIIINAGRTVSNLVFKPMLTTNLDATYDDYERYIESTVHIDSTTEFPLFGLKSFDGETNIISPANVKCVYPTNESGKGVLDSLYNKDKMLTEQNKSLEVLGKCKNLLNPTLRTVTQDGITCTDNGDGTYTLNGTCSVDSPKTTIILTSESMKIDEDVKFICCTQSGSSDKFRASVDYDDGTYSVDYGEGTLLSKGKTITKISIIVSNGATVNNLLFKPMLTTNLNATYDDFVPYTGDGETLASDVAEIKNDLGGLSFSASGTTLSITDGTNTWTLEANS